MGLTFIPYLRAGLARDLQAPDGEARNRAALSVDLSLNGVEVAAPSLQLLGPGDVAGVDTGQILRTYPAPDAQSVPASRFALVEFRDPALTWLLTPEPAAHDRLRPWLCLVVVERRAGVSVGPGARPGTTELCIEAPALVADELPDLALSWSWAHVQVTGSVADEADLRRIARDEPERVLSRLICPRKLVAERDYIACLVPAFFAGRDAGLGGDPDPQAVLADAWVQDAPDVRLPVYHAWSFRTGGGDDFLAYASRLRGVPCPAGVGDLALDLTGLAPAGEPQVVTACGALTTPAPAGGTEPGFETRRRLAVACSRGAAPEELGSPMYGAAYTGVVDLAPEADGWQAAVNLDPRHRAIAGVGARIARAEQESIVAAAWEQAGAVADANRLLDGARAVRAAGEQMRTRHLAPLDPAVLVQVLGPAHGRIRTSLQTVAERLDAAGVPAHAFSPALRRVTRPRGPVMRGVLRAAPAARSLRGGAPEAGSPAARAWLASGLEAPPAPPTLAARPRPRQDDGPIDGHLRAVLLERVRPDRTVPDRVLPRVEVPAPPAADPSGNGQPPAPATQAVDPLLPVRSSPVFDAPMADLLAAADADLLLPGADAIATDRATIVRTNPAFVAAFMAGLNSEAARELVWRDLPLDRSATLFRRFWSRTGPEDVAPVNSWPAEARLDELAPARAQHLVLVIRGELLRAYPSTAVYAVRAEDDGSGPKPADETKKGNVLEPDFSGGAGADLRYFAFAMSEQDARSEPGWFFVLQEQIFETRFATNAASMPALATSADTAAATVAPPVRLAMHADRLLP